MAAVTPSAVTLLLLLCILVLAVPPPALLSSEYPTAPVNRDSLEETVDAMLLEEEEGTAADAKLSS